MADFKQNALVDGLVEGIPLAEAAGFFVSLKQAAVVPLELSEEEEKTAASKLQRKIAELIAGPMPAGKAGRFKPVDEIKEAEKTASVEKVAILGFISKTKANKKFDAAHDAGESSVKKEFQRAQDQYAAYPKPGNKTYFQTYRSKAQAAGYPVKEWAKTAATLGARLKEIEGREKKRLTATHRESGALRSGGAAGAAGAALGAGAAALLKKNPKRGAQIGAALGGGAGAVHGGLKGQKKGETVAKNIGKMRRVALVESALRRRGARHAVKDMDMNQLKALGYSVRSKAAAMHSKLAEGPGGLQQDPQQEAAPAQQMPAAAQPQQPQQQQAAPEAPTMPTNYLGAETQARQAQQQNEAGYYRALLEQVGAENQAAQAQLQELGAQMQELQTQGQQTTAHIEQATQQAVEAQDRATEHSQQAANMRMGMQKMREQMMQIASQDPDTFAPMQPPQAPMDALNQPMQGDQPQPGSEQSAQAGTPGQSPEPGGGAPNGSKSPESSSGSEGSEAKSDSGSGSKDTAKTQVQVKTSGMSPGVMGALGGAAMGGIAGAAEGASMGGQVPALEQKVQGMEARGQEGGFTRAVRFAQAKAKLDIARAAQADPEAAALKGGAMGAIAGAGAGAGLGRLAGNLKSFSGV